MKLIGKFDSPFVRRVAISLDHFGLHFEHADWSVGADFARILEFCPLGRVPVLVLDDGDVLTESAAILDYLDEVVGSTRALLPPQGLSRRESLRIMAFATGAVDKAREIVYEHRRPADKAYEDWVSRCRRQMHGALAQIESVCLRRASHKWLVEERMTQADITVACMLTFLRESGALVSEAAHYPVLGAHTARCEALPLFQDNHLPWFSFTPQ
ncbi:MAG: glutathione S-transferase family protein [Steroidobacteraceae bacterium]